MNILDFVCEKNNSLCNYSLKNEFDKLKELLKTNTDVNQSNPFGITPLMFAAGEGHYKICQLLLKAGANVNIQDNFGYTALMHAIESKNICIIYLLFCAGANFYLRNNEGLSAFDLIIERFLFNNNFPCFLELCEKN